MKLMVSAIFVILTSLTLLSVGCGQKPLPPSRFKIALIVDEPSQITDDFNFTNTFTATGETVVEHLHVSKFPVCEQSEVVGAELQKYPGNPVQYIQITFTDEGRRHLAEATRQNKGRRFAFIIDGNVISAPTIAAEITEGKAMIGSMCSAEQAKALAGVINAAIHN